MTFTDLVTEVMARTRQTSTEAQARIGRAINDRNRRICTSVGLQTSRMGTSGATLASGQSEIVIPNTVKVFTVYVDAAVDALPRILAEVTPDEWRTLMNASTAPRTGPPERFAVWMSAFGGTPASSRVTLKVYPVADRDYAMQADCLLEATDLVGTDRPTIAQDFHDILMHGALADEWFQLKQDDLSKRSEAMYEQRLSELRYFIIKSSYLDIHQGKRTEWAYPWSHYGSARPWW